MEQYDIMEAAERTGVAVPERMLPGQFYDMWHQAAARSGEHRLLVAILEDAIQCWLGTGRAWASGNNNPDWLPGQHGRLYYEAENWIFNDTAQALVTFAEVCAVLELEPEWLRAALRKRAATAAAAAPGNWVSRGRIGECMECTSSTHQQSARDKRANDRRHASERNATRASSLSNGAPARETPLVRRAVRDPSTTFEMLAPPRITEGSLSEAKKSDVCAAR
jgi:hypothetical protein